MRLPHFRLRALMIAVAVLGLTLGGAIEAVRLARLSRSYRDRAAFHAAIEESYRGTAARYGDGHKVKGFRASADRHGDGDDVMYSMSADARMVPVRDIIDSQVKMRLKYEHAARYPWLPVGPDPPGPESPQVTS
jgi:hypothetical protein